MPRLLLSSDEGLGHEVVQFEALLRAYSPVLQDADESIAHEPGKNVTKYNAGIFSKQVAEGRKIEADPRQAHAQHGIFAFPETTLEAFFAVDRQPALQNGSKVRCHVADVRPPLACDKSRRSQTETDVVGEQPVAEIVVRDKTGVGEIGDLVVLKSACHKQAPSFPHRCQNRVVVWHDFMTFSNGLG